MIIVHDLDSEKVYLASSVENGKNKTDKSGIEEAIKLKDTIVIGRTIYEYNRPLEAFVERWGHRWKSILRDAWETGGYPSSTPRVDIPALQRLRNSIGSI